MTHILISNVGSRDVKLAVGGVEQDIKPPRSRGEAIWRDYESHRPLLRFPMLAKAINHVLAEDGQIDKVYLVATDQPEPPTTRDEYWRTDTIYFAQIIKRWVVETYGFSETDIEILRLDSDPSDYAILHNFFEETLAEIKGRHDDSAVFHLEIAGGTPAMTSMLLVCGADIFGAMGRPLYVKEGQITPYPMQIGAKLVLQTLRKNLKSGVQVYGYEATRKAVDDNEPFLQAVWPEALTIVRPLCDYALHRRNFVFNAARKSLEGLADSLDAAGAGSSEQSLLDSLPTNYVERLAEGIHNARLAYERHNLLDFVVRVFQFEEGCLRFICLRRGVQFERDGVPDATGKMVSSSWLQASPDQTAYLQKKKVNGIDTFEVGSNRFTMGLLAVGGLPKNAPEKKWKAQLDALEAVGNLRNLAVHAYEPLTLDQLGAAYTEKSGGEKAAADILPDMENLWRQLADQESFPPNPFHIVNRLLLSRLAETINLTAAGANV